ncbi:MAG TPA: ABC transporter substrate-binding protein [Burkholderiales bacterium]|nr:ABC transporter substrate-binding protein [Burkholderiales bacterium]
MIRVYAALLASIAAFPALAQTKLDMVGFGGASNLPVWVAQERGLFAKEGLEVKFDRTPSSGALFRNLMAGKYQVASAAFDNVVAYVEGQAEQTIEGFDVVSFLGVHGGLVSLMTTPDVKDFAGLKGKTAAVDSAASGYALLMYRILDQKGLAKDRDYRIVSVGGTGERLQAMREGRAAAGMISPPQDLEARKLGFHTLGEPTKALGAYTGSVYNVRRAWAKDHEKELVAFARAIVAAHDVIFTDRAAAIEVLRKRLKELSAGDAAAVYAKMTGPGGFTRKAQISIRGARVVLAVRSQYGEPAKKLTDPYKYMDLRYYRKAMREGG